MSLHIVRGHSGNLSISFINTFESKRNRYWIILWMFSVLMETNIKQKMDLISIPSDKRNKDRLSTPKQAHVSHYITNMEFQVYNYLWKCNTTMVWKRKKKLRTPNIFGAFRMKSSHFWVRINLATLYNSTQFIFSNL